MSKGASTRERIVDRAAALASRVGLDGLTIGALAQQLGLSKSGLFAHFKSKEALEVEVVEHCTSRFVDVVVRPALRAPRGEPRVRALFDNLLAWPSAREFPGGCPFVALASELDDRPGPARSALVRQQRDWQDTLTQVARTGITEGHFRSEIDPEQLAFELLGIQFTYHHALRLLEDPKAEARARTAFEALIVRAAR